MEYIISIVSIVISEVFIMSYKTIAIPEPLKERFDEFQWQSRSKSQADALKKLLDCYQSKKVEVEA